MIAEREEAEAIRARLRWAVFRSGLSAARAEAAAGMTAGAISQISLARCRRVSVARMRALATVLRVRLAWLLCGDGPAWWELRGGTTGGLVLWTRAHNPRFLERRDARTFEADISQGGTSRMAVVGVRPSAAALARALRRRRLTPARLEGAGARAARERREIEAKRRREVDARWVDEEVRR